MVKIGKLNKVKYGRQRIPKKWRNEEIRRAERIDKERKYLKVVREIYVT